MQKPFALFATLIVAGALASGPTAAAPRATTARGSEPHAGTAGAFPAIHAPAPVAAEGLTEGTRLAAIYDTILRAQFDVARAELAQACPPAPTAACDGLREVALWWQIQQNQSSRLLDARFEASAAAAIASATKWTGPGAVAG